MPISFNPPYRKRWRLVHLPTIDSMRKRLNAHHKAQKSSKNFKPSLTNVVSTGANFTKKYVLVSLCLLAVLGWHGIV